eukprot:TRINITY_DN20785_c0_g1_i1.p1 TRINITY_DN20785_c0_g1~~TRINITY_DN20785_c0_g1_i1.p1  ORF type:complete len:797 (+),score=82.71 TRINITY_DN20785_c0_g1_i1:72-2462(+)
MGDDTATGYLGRPLLDMQKQKNHDETNNTKSMSTKESSDKKAEDKKSLPSQLRKVTSLCQAAKSDRERLRIDQQLTISALLGLTLMMFQSISVWYYGSGIIVLPTGVIIPNDDFAEWVFYCSVVSKGLTAALSVVSICLLGKYYRLLLNDKRREWSQEVIPEALTSSSSHRYRFTSSTLLWKFILEVGIHLLFPYPWLAKTQPTMYHFLQLGMFLRLYLVARLLHTSSAAFRKRNFLRSFYFEFRKINWSIKWNITLKILFYEHSVFMVSLCTFVTLCISAFALFILERKRQENHDFSELGNCLWFSFVTFTTIGYGDMTPKTISGRVVTAILGLVGQVILAVFGGVVTNKLTPSKQQQMVVSFLDSETGGKEVRTAAATLIQAVWRASRATRKWRETREKKSSQKRKKSARSFIQGLSKHKENQVYAAVKKFRSNRCQSTSIEANDPVIDHKLDVLQNDMEDLAMKLNAFIDHFTADDDSNNFSSNGNGAYQRSPTLRGSPTFRGRLSTHRTSNSSNKNIFTPKTRLLQGRSIREPREGSDLGGENGRKRKVSFARKNSDASNSMAISGGDDDFKIQLEGSSIFDARSEGSSGSLEDDRDRHPPSVRKKPAPLNFAKRGDRVSKPSNLLPPDEPTSEVASSDSWDKPEDSSETRKLLEAAASLINPKYTPLAPLVSPSTANNPLKLGDSTQPPVAGALRNPTFLGSPNSRDIISNNSTGRFTSPELNAYKMPLYSPHSNKSLASPSLLPSPTFPSPSAASVISQFGPTQHSMVPFPHPPTQRSNNNLGDSDNVAL